MVELRRPRTAALRRLDPGTCVCLVEDRPLARRRLRRVVQQTGLSVERELVAVPTTQDPIVLVDDEESAVRHFWSSVATVPPGLARTALPAAAALRLTRLLPWSWTGALVPGRIVIGTMP
jgi:hypothetical protein